MLDAEHRLVPDLQAGIGAVEEGGGVRFDPPLDMDYDASVCVLNEIKEAGVTKLGFVGNEKASEPEGR